MTIQDVADKAGVTKGTVSKFLNAQSGYYVAEATRSRIEVAIAELDFQPSTVAQGLSSNRTMSIGVIAADIRNPFYPDLIAGVQEVVEPEGYTVILGSSGSDSEREFSIVRSMIRRRVDGVVLASVRMGAEEVVMLANSGITVALASRCLPSLVADTVVVDNYAGAIMAVDHLVRLGHRRIGHIAGPQDIMPFRERMIGFRDAMAKHGLPLDENLVSVVSSSSAEGAQSADHLLRRDDPPSALFVANDNMAIGAMDSARRLGFSIPGDVSIVGFDNISIGANSFIALTTIDSDARWLGQDAANLLMTRLESSDPSRPWVMKTHPPKLIVRGSTAHARG